MNRKGPWEGYRQKAKPVVSFPPSFARTFSSKERLMGTRQEQSEVYGEAGPLVGSIPSAMVTSSVLLFASSLLFERFLQAQKYELKATTIL